MMIQPGMRFGSWKIIALDEPERIKFRAPRRRWVVECICGVKGKVFEINLLSGTTKSCGCMQGHYQRITRHENSKNKID